MSHNVNKSEMNRQQFSSFYGCCNLFYGLFKYLIHSFITARLDYSCSLYVSLLASSIVGWECRGTLFPYFFSCIYFACKQIPLPKGIPQAFLHFFFRTTILLPAGLFGVPGLGPVFHCTPHWKHSQI